MPGTGIRCVCSWPCPEPHARQRGDRAVPNLPPPATAGTRAGLGGSAPIHALGHGRTPAVIRLCLRKSERVPSAAKPQTSGNEGPRWPPTAGTRHRGQTSVPVRGEYPSRRSPCGRLGWPVTPGTGRIPPKGPKRVQHYRRQSVVSTGRKLLSGYGRCQEGYHLDCLASTHRTSDTGQRFTCQPFYLLRTAGPPARAAAARRRPARAGAHEAASPP
jgi:hypothetical protein